MDMLLDSAKFPNMISRVHAKLLRQPDGQFSVVDNGSLNGVFVNNMRIASSVLHVGDLVVFGGTQKSKIGRAVSARPRVVQFLTRCRLQATLFGNQTRSLCTLLKSIPWMTRWLTTALWFALSSHC